MNIKKYHAGTLKEAIEQMKEELGEEAIVLSTRVFQPPGSPAGVKMFEVVAGLDQSAEVKKPVINTVTGTEAKSAYNDEFEKALSELRKKIFDVKKEMGNLPKFSSPPKKETSGVQSSPRMRKTESNENATVSKQGKSQVLRANDFFLENLKSELLDKDIQPETVKMLIGQLQKSAAFLKAADLESALLSTMASLIPTASLDVRERKKGKVAVFVGPTGVGKTTCIAKIAAISKLLHKLDIGLITLDTYRLGAVDQLRAFAEISDIPFLVAYTPDDLKKAVSGMKKKDLIFVDTAGRSQNNTESISAIRKTLDVLNDPEVILVLNATASSKNLTDVAKKFQLLAYKGLIFTKLDEAVTFGNILNLVVKYPIPIKYLTNGQVIPDDILAANAEFIANAIYTGKYAKV